jgi:hypothetical protein
LANIALLVEGIIGALRQINHSKKGPARPETITRGRPRRLLAVWKNLGNQNVCITIGIIVGAVRIGDQPHVALERVSSCDGCSLIIGTILL